MAREQRRLAAIVAADVAGYARLMGRDESGTLASLKALRRELVDPAIAAHGGRIVKTTGDGLLLEFASVVDAVRCVIEVQAAIGARAADVPEDQRIALRIGVNLGDIIIDGDDIFGDGVNIAARLEAIAAPGGVCLSDDVYRQVRGKIDAAFDELGPQTLKNIAQPVNAWSLRIDRGTGQAASPAASPQSPLLLPDSLPLPDRPSIAVLPFENMSGDPEQEYFTDGITEDIITELSRFHSLFVIARHSSFSYKGRSPGIRQVGRELGVRYVVEGSIRKSSNRIRVTGQLIDTVTGNHIWAERYDRVLEDIFAVQEEVTQAIVAAVTPQIELTERSKAARRRPENLSAYEIALRGYAHAWEGRDTADRTIFDLSIREANRALALDPTSVLALHAIAIAYSNALNTHLVEDREHAIREATRAVARAIELDGTNALSYAQRGIFVMLSGQLDRYPDALVDARRAHALNPNDTFVLRLLGTLESAVGEHERAIDHGRQILRLNPREPRNHMTYNLMAYASFGAKKYREGIDWASRALADMPRLVIAHNNLVVCLVGAGEIDKARAAFDVGQRLAPGLFKTRLEGASSYARVKDRERAILFLRIAAGLEAPGLAETLR